MTVADTVHVLYFGEIIARGDMAAIQQNARRARSLSRESEAMLEVNSTRPATAR